MSGVIEERVSQHYSRGDLEQAILDALAKSGKDIDRLTPADLSPVDEFHTAGRQATIELMEQLDFKPGMHIVDIGSGIGGPSRYLAETRDCRVTGIDLTEDYVRTASALAQRVGLSDRVSYRQASALSLPFDDASFDGAMMMHVGMNIEDKAALCREVRRALKPAATFAIFDMMRMGDGELAFPVHWAASAATSFVAPPADYRRALEDAGFEIVKERSRRDFALDFFRQSAARIKEMGGPPALGIHILMKTDVPQKIANVLANLEKGLIAPTEIISRAK